MTPDSSNRVPPGHQVAVTRRSVEPLVGRGIGGALVASTGVGGDDQLREVAALLTDVERQLAPQPVLLVTRLTQLSDLFAPTRVEAATLVGACLVFFQRGSVAGFGDAELAFDGSEETVSSRHGPDL